jgi:glycosyltransferase involved in cell wall biosynthesis
MFTGIVLQLFFVSIIVQLLYVFFIFRRAVGLSQEHQETEIAERKKVSVVICARNEGHNLYKNLSAILKQQYLDTKRQPNFEVVVVNDASIDDTVKVLAHYKEFFKNLVVVQLESKKGTDSHYGKKYCIKKGVEAAKGDFILFTDADCKPTGYDWLENMTAPLHNGKQFALGYAGYYRTSGLLNAFVRWETLHTFVQYSSYALAGIPYMGVGRNLACTKEIFLAIKDAETWNKSLSGDDDLLVNIAATGRNTAVVGCKRAFTYTDAKTSLKEYMAQKQRHLSVGKLYNTRSKILLGIYATSHALLWLSFILLLAFRVHFVLLPMLLRCATYWTVWFLTAAKVNEEREYYLFPLFDIGWVVYNFVFSPYIFWKTIKNWK